MATLESLDRGRRKEVIRLRLRWFFTSVVFFSIDIVVTTVLIVGMDWSRFISHVFGPLEIFKAPTNQILPHLAIFVLILHLEVIGIWHRKPILIILGWLLFCPWWFFLANFLALARMVR